jgi:ABC-type cobalamin transport system permease subunit
MVWLVPVDGKYVPGHEVDYRWQMRFPQRLLTLVLGASVVLQCSFTNVLVRCARAKNRT